MAYDKVNIVTNPDGTDTFRCSDCGHTQKYPGLERDSSCPKCKKHQKKGVALGFWTAKDTLSESKCYKCKQPVIEVPKEGHPNSKFWPLQKYDDEVLVVCDHGCVES